MNENWKVTPHGVVIAGRQLPVTRGQIMMVLVAINLIFLSIDILLAHGMNGNLNANEWIPIWFGIGAGVFLLVAGAISLRQRTLAILLSFIVFAASIVVGLVGAYFHVQRAIPPNLFESEPLIVLLIFAPPIVGPLTYSLLGVLGVIASVYEEPLHSGRMVIPGVAAWPVPFSKTQQYCIWVGLGILATLLSSVLDHGRFNFENLWVWLPTIIGVFATVAAIAYGMTQEPNRMDVIVYVSSMVALLLVGVIGFVLHVEADLGTRNTIVIERFLRGAPFMAPLLFADMAALGLVAILPMEERRSEGGDDKA